MFKAKSLIPRKAPGALQSALPRFFRSAFPLLLLAACLWPFASGLCAQTELGSEDDLTVLGANGTQADPDVEIKGFSVFGSTQAAPALEVPVAPGNIFVNGYVQVSSGMYVAGSSTFTAGFYSTGISSFAAGPGSIYIKDGVAGQVLKKVAGGGMQWGNDEGGVAGSGTQYRIPMWNSDTALTNSVMAQSATADGVTVMASSLTVQGNVLVSSLSATGDISAARYQINGSTVLAILPGTYSFAAGPQAGERSVGSGNTFIGGLAGTRNTTGGYNTFIGQNSGYENTLGVNNTFVGQQAGNQNLVGSGNTHMGTNAGYNSKGSANVILGQDAAGYMFGTMTFSSATIVGNSAGYNLTSGADNILVGYKAGYSITTGTGNIVIGYDKGTTGAAASSQLNIGGLVYGDLSNKTLGVGRLPTQHLAALDIVSTGTAQTEFAQIWRDSGGNIKSSMSATGVMMADKFIGDGSGLEGVTGTDDTKVLKAGDTMTGRLTAPDYTATYGILAASAAFSSGITASSATLTGELGVWAARHDMAAGASVSSAPASRYGGVYVSTHAYFATGSSLYNVSTITATGALTVHSSITVAGNGGQYGLQVSSGVSLGGLLYSNNGNVGVGVEAPTAKLHVSGGAAGVPSFQVDGSSYVIFNSSSVGIGTTLPAYPLDVFGPYTRQLRVSGGAGNLYGGIRLGRYDTNQAADIIFDANGQNSMTLSTLYGSDSNAIILSPGAGSGMTVTRVGVSVGGTTPNARLDVISTGTAQTEFAQIWRDSGGNIKSSMSATGVLMAATLVLPENTLYVAGGSENQVLKKNAAGYLAWGDDQGGVSGSGIQYRIPMWNSDTALTNSVMAQSATADGVTVMASSLTVQGNVLVSSLSATGNISAARYQINGSTVLALLPGSGSIGIGASAGEANAGARNIFMGYSAGQNNSAATDNVFIGDMAGNTNTLGAKNTFIGSSAGTMNMTGEYNTSVGYTSGQMNGTGSANTLLGYAAAGKGGGTPSYSSNTVVGYQAGYSLASGGNDNILVGWKAGYSITTGTGNIIIGYDKTASAAGASNELNIGGAIYGDLVTKSITFPSTVTIGGAQGVYASRHMFAAGVEISSAPGSQYGGIYVSTHIYVSSNIYAGENALYVAGGSENQVLKKSAGGWLAWADDQGGVSGSGIQYRIPMWNSDTVLTNSVMAQSATADGVTLMGSSLTVQGGAFSVGGSTLAVSAGRVGIGTASPADVLHVSKVLTVSDDTVNQYLHGKTSGLDGVSDNFSLRQTFRGNDANYNDVDFAYIRASKGISSAGTPEGTLAFGTKAQGGALADAVTIEGSGSVGISTNAPEARLDVKAAGSAPSDIVQIWRDSEGAVVSSMNATGLLTLSSAALSGNLGVGTANPAYKLSVYSAAAAAVSNTESGSDGSAAWSRYAGKTDGAEAQVWGTGLNITDGSGGFELYDFTGGESRVYVSTYGNVGLGVTVPTHKLHVAGSALVTSSMSVSGAGLSGTDPVFQVAGGTLTVRYDGHVGIGLAAPDAGLHVQTYEDGKNTLYVSTSATAGVYSVAVSSTGITNIRNLIIENKTSDPESPVTGQIWLRIDLE